MDVLERARQLHWYHSVELAPGYVTAGVFDLRPYVDRYGLPERMDGMRALDVGTFDGFWAFEMERRGADVVAIDIDDAQDLDWPPRRRPAVDWEMRRGETFELASAVLDSDVRREPCSVYEARPENLGVFDVVLCGSVLMHLRDQLLALERIAGLCRGTFISAEEYDLASSLLPFSVSRYHADRDSSVVFWLPSARTWRRMLWTAGFDRVEEHARFKLKSNEGYSVRHVVHHAGKGPP